LILPHLGRSEKGLVNTEYKRYLARIPKTFAVAKFGYSDDVHLLEPILARPLMITCNEPSDREILNKLGGSGPAVVSNRNPIGFDPSSRDF